MAERSSLCAEALSNNPTDHGEQKANANAAIASAKTRECEEDALRDGAGRAAV